FHCPDEIGTFAQECRALLDWLITERGDQRLPECGRFRLAHADEFRSRSLFRGRCGKCEQAESDAQTQVNSPPKEEEYHTGAYSIWRFDHSGANRSLTVASL